ncbi:8698_t:CDS:2, partial [Cetraspora pellucida]
MFNNKNSSIAGVGVFFKDNDSRNISERLPEIQQTNNRAELYAADRLAFLGSQKSFVKNLNFNSSNKEKIDFYFTKKEQTDNSDTAQDSYLNEFFRILKILENDKDQQKLTIETKNKNIYLMLKEERIKYWLKNNWCHKETNEKLKAPKEIYIKIKELIDSRSKEIDF